MRHLRVLVLALTTIALSACAASSRRAPSSGNVITRAELAALESISAYEAIQRLRPTWLRPRGPTSLTGGPTYPDIHINDSRSRTLDELRGIPVTEVESMAYHSASDATTRFGTGYAGGVIEVRTRR